MKSTINDLDTYVSLEVNMCLYILYNIIFPEPSTSFHKTCDL